MEKLKKSIAIITVLFLIIGFMAGKSASAGFSVFKKEDKRFSLDYQTDEIIVKFKGDTEPFKVVKVPQGKVGEKIKEYLKRTEVEFAEPNFIARALMVPNDSYYHYQWHLDNQAYGAINMEDAWDLTDNPGEGVTIAVVDTGISYENYCESSGWRSICYEKAPDFENTCFVGGYDFINNDAHANDDSSPGHGTHVAGTIAQSTNNNLGTAGISFKSCLMPVKVLGSNGSGTYAQVIDGIRWAADHGADVINLSLGGSEHSQALEEAVAYAYNQGVVVIAASGNDGTNIINYPAAYDDYVIAVGATRYDEALAPYSNFGQSLDLVAPGGDLDVDQNNDGYGDGVLQQTYEKPYSWRPATWGYYFMSGTSMASPHVAGVAGLLLAQGEVSSPDDVRNVLFETARDLGADGRDNTFGWGIVDAYAALNWNPVVQPVCFSDSDCSSNNECTSGACINAGLPGAYCASEPIAEEKECDDNKFCTVDDRCFNGACLGVLRDCSDEVACTADSCSEEQGRCFNEPDNSYCNDGLFCSGEEYCSALLGCITSAPVNCDDNNDCTADSCSESQDACQNLPAADNTGCEGGICCQGVCQAGVSECQSGEPCWEAGYQYLYRRSSQLSKFCKCAQGAYGYESYSYTLGRSTVYQYSDSKDNENWEVSSRTYFIPVHEVVCSDHKTYSTKQDYYYSQ